MIGDYFRLSLRSLVRRKMRSWLTIIGIVIGIAAVISLVGLGEGLRQTINDQFGFLGADILSVTASGGFGPPGSGVVDPLTDKELDSIKDVNGVRGAAGRIMESGKIVFNKKAVFTYIVSMPDGEDREIIEGMVNMEAQKGRLLEDSDKGVVVMGANFLEEDNQFGKAISSGSRVNIQDKEFKVIGIMEKEGNMQVDRAVLMNDNDLRDLVGREKGEYDMIAVKFDTNIEVNEIKADIEKRLRRIRDVKEGEENFAVDTPQSILESVNSTLLAVQIFVYIIAGISILVGGIGIMNTMYTAVVERTKEIGIMKAMGARNGSIFSLFFIESGLLGTIGGLIGIIFGAATAYGMAFIGKLVLGSSLISAYISLELILMTLFFSFIVGSFFGTMPAMRASKLNPVDAMRFIK